jgi:hypothetical protein
VKTIQEIKFFREIVAKTEKFYAKTIPEIKIISKLSRKLPQKRKFRNFATSERIFAFRENERRSFRFNPISNMTALVLPAQAWATTALHCPKSQHQFQTTTGDAEGNSSVERKLFIDFFLEVQ